MLLADMGATVIKVESPQGDDTRTWTPPTHNDVATYYMSINRNKRSIVLDFALEEDRKVGLDLIKRADIFIENFKTGGLKKFGFDYESVAPINPALIYLSISGFGTAEGAWLPGYDLIVQAVSGLMSLTGEPDGPPFRAGISVFDVMAGLHGLIGVLTALHQRHNTGLGQHVEVNLLSSAMSGLVNQTAAYAAAGVVPFRMGNAHPSLFPTKHCQQKIAISSSLQAMTDNLERCAKFSRLSMLQTIHFLRSMPIAQRIVNCCDHCSLPDLPSGLRTICLLRLTK